MIKKVHKHLQKHISREDKAWKYNDRIFIAPLLTAALVLFVLSFVRSDARQLVEVVPNNQNYLKVFSDGAVYQDDNLVGELSDSNFVAAAGRQDGFWAVTEDGDVFTFGSAVYHGSLEGSIPPAPIVDVVTHPSVDGYRLISSSGAVYDFNTIRISEGSLPASGVTEELLTSPIVAGAGTASGKGYWLVSSAGRVYAFGDAAFSGDVVSNVSAFASSIVDIVADQLDPNAYMLVSAEGQVFEFPSGVVKCEPERTSSGIVSFVYRQADSACVFGSAGGTVENN